MKKRRVCSCTGTWSCSKPCFIGSVFIRTLY
jgi:hypothetical protein